MVGECMCVRAREKERESVPLSAYMHLKIQLEVFPHCVFIDVIKFYFNWKRFFPHFSFSSFLAQFLFLFLFFVFSKRNMKSGLLGINHSHTSAYMDMHMICISIHGIFSGNWDVARLSKMAKWQWARVKMMHRDRYIIRGFGKSKSAKWRNKWNERNE